MNKDDNNNNKDRNDSSSSNDDDDQKSIKIEDNTIDEKSKKLQKHEILFAGIEFYRFFYLHQQLYRLLKQIKTSLDNSSQIINNNNNNNNLKKKIEFSQFLNQVSSLFKGEITQKEFAIFCEQIFGTESCIYSQIGEFSHMILSQMKKLIFDGKTDYLVKLYEFERSNENFIENVYLSNCSVLMDSPNFFRFELDTKNKENDGDSRDDDDGDGDDKKKDGTINTGNQGKINNEDDENNLLYTIHINLVENKIRNEKDLSNDLQKNKRINEKILSKFRAVGDIDDNEFIIKQQIFLPRNSKKWKQRGEEATQNILILNELEQKFKLDTMESKYIQETEDIFYRFGWLKKASKFQETMKNENERK